METIQRAMTLRRKMKSYIFLGLQTIMYRFTEIEASVKMLQPTHVCAKATAMAQMISNPIKLVCVQNETEYTTATRAKRKSVIAKLITKTLADVCRHEDKVTARMIIPLPNMAIIARKRSMAPSAMFSELG